MDKYKETKDFSGVGAHDMRTLILLFPPRNNSTYRWIIPLLQKHYGIPCSVSTDYTPSSALLANTYRCYDSVIEITNDINVSDGDVSNASNTIRMIK